MKLSTLKNYAAAFAIVATSANCLASPGSGEQVAQNQAAAGSITVMAKGNGKAGNTAKLDLDAVGAHVGQSKLQKIGAIKAGKGAVVIVGQSAGPSTVEAPQQIIAPQMFDPSQMMAMQMQQAQAHQFQLAQLEAQQASMVAQEMVPLFGGQGSMGIYPNSMYAGLRAQCGGYISVLEGAINWSGNQANFNVDKATTRIYRALEWYAKVSSIGNSFGFASAHSTIAARHAYAMATLIMNEVPAFGSVLGQNVSVVKYFAVKNAARLVVAAYKQLDEPYFFNVIEIGRSKRWIAPNDFSFTDDFFDNSMGFEGAEDYFGKSSKLAQMFLQYYAATSKTLGHNLLKAMVLGQSTHAAARLLATSGFRLKTSCVILELGEITREAHVAVREFLSSPVQSNREAALYWSVSALESQVSDIASRLNLICQ